LGDDTAQTAAQAVQRRQGLLGLPQEGDTGALGGYSRAAHYRYPHKSRLKGQGVVYPISHKNDPFTSFLCGFYPLGFLEGRKADMSFGKA
jgi:hypothetical protein